MEIIHPIWAKDEKARILRVCVWLSPFHAPIITERMADIIIRFGSISS